MVILQQFSIITQELQNFTNKVSGDIHKITQVCQMTKVNTSWLLLDAISQALVKPQDSPQVLILPENSQPLPQTKYQTH